MITNELNIHDSGICKVNSLVYKRGASTAVRRKTKFRLFSYHRIRFGFPPDRRKG